MNVPEIRGLGNLRPGRERKAGKPGEEGIPSRERPAESPDTVSLSPEFSRQAMELDRLVDLARAEDPGRMEVLSEVRERLESGALNRPEVFRKAAEKILYGE